MSCPRCLASQSIASGFFNFGSHSKVKHFRQSGPFKWSTESRLALVKMYGLFSITPMVHHK